MAMTPKEIHQALAGICSTFPKSSKTFVGFIDHASKTGAMEGTMQHAGCDFNEERLATGKQGADSQLCAGR